MSFSFLHISDMHFDTEPTSSWISRIEIINKIKSEVLSPNCIVISGDLFNRGSLSKSRIDDYRDYLKKLPGEKATFLAVPGNHDLDRSAQLREEESYNVFLTRKHIVFEAGEKSKEHRGEYDLNDREKKVLYGQSFYDFQSFAKRMRFNSFCNPNASDEAKNYEVQIVDLPIPEKSDLKTRFVLLNTAVFAGQSVRGAEFQKRQRQLEKDRQAALAEDNPVRAAEIFLDMTRNQQRFETDGEFIIDEEIKSGWGRISLSREGNRILSEINSDGAAITFFVGHHGVEYLSEQTQTALKTAMKRCGSGIYLCGHAHLSRFSRFPIETNSTPMDIEQAQAGVMFEDYSKFAQYGFNYISFNIKGNHLEGKVTSFFIIKSVSNASRWMKEDIIKFNIILNSSVSNTSQQNTCNPDNIENKKDSRKPPSGDDESNSTKGRPASTSNFSLSNLKQSKK